MKLSRKPCLMKPMKTPVNLPLDHYDLLDIMSAYYGMQNQRNWIIDQKAQFWADLGIIFSRGPQWQISEFGVSVLRHAVIYETHAFFCDHCFLIIWTPYNVMPGSLGFVHHGIFYILILSPGLICGKFLLFFLLFCYIAAHDDLSEGWGTTVKKRIKQR